MVMSDWYLISGEGDCGEGDCGEADCGARLIVGRVNGNRLVIGQIH